MIEWKRIFDTHNGTITPNKTYNYTIRTGSYPQIRYNKTLTNRKVYEDGIPAIRLE